MRERWAAELRARVGANVRQHRLGLALSQEELASRAGMATRHLQKAEAGEVNLTLKTLAALAGTLGIDPETLFRKPDTT